MKILRFMGYPISKLGSLERYVHAQASEMGKQGHDVQIVYDGGGDSLAGAMAARTYPDVKVHYHFPSPAPGLSAVLDHLRYFFKALAFIRKGGFDIVHTYFEPSTQIVNLLAPMLPGTVFVRTMGVVPRHPDTSTLIGKLKQLYHYLNLLNYDKVICVSEAVRDSLLMYKIKPELLSIIYNAVDTSSFKRYHTRPAHPDPFYLTFCGRLERIKNIECLIRGMSILTGEYRTKNVILNLYGEGSHAGFLRDLVVREKLEPYVHFRGLSHDIVRTLNECTDIYVQASFSEGLPASVLEAMACELPVAVSRIGGHCTIVRHGINGLLFDPHSPGDFAERVHQLAHSCELRKELAANARQTVLDSYDNSVSIRRESSVYESLLNSR